MNPDLAQIFLQYAGIAIVAAVTLQAFLMLANSFRRRGVEVEQHRLAREVLQHRLDTALAGLRFENEKLEQVWNGYRKFEIIKKEREIEDCHSFYLAPHDGKPLPPFLPGQYLTFQLKIPGHSKPVIRCYSLSDSPNHPDYYRVLIKKIPPPRDDPNGLPGRSSTFFNDVLEAGDIVDVKAPAGHFYLEQQDRPIVLIGGGIGITPVMSMLNTLCENQHNGEVWFFLGATNSSDQIMKTHLEALERAHENLHVCVCYSHPLDGDVAGRDYQQEGFVSIDLFKSKLSSSNYTFYICGPPPMMEAIVGGLYEWGVPEESVNFEAFGMATVKKAAKSKQKAKEGADAAPELEIVFDRSGKTLIWDPDAESLLDFAEDKGIINPFFRMTWKRTQYLPFHRVGQPGAGIDGGEASRG